MMFIAFSRRSKGGDGSFFLSLSSAMDLRRDFHIFLSALAIPVSGMNGVTTCELCPRQYSFLTLPVMLN